MKVFEIKTVTVDEVYDYLESHERYKLQEEFDILLDESTENIDIFGVEYPPSHVFKNTDIVRYDMELDSYILDQAEQILYDVRNGETVEMYNCIFQ